MRKKTAAIYLMCRPPLLSLGVAAPARGISRTRWGKSLQTSLLKTHRNRNSTVKPWVYQNFLAMLNPKMRGSSVNTLVVRPVSSLLTKVSVIGALLNTFFTYACTLRPQGECM